MNNLTDKQVEDILNSQFHFIHETIRVQEIANTQPNDWDELKSSFILRHIGKIYTDVDTIQKIHNRKSFLKKLKEEHGETTIENN